MYKEILSRSGRELAETIDAKKGCISDRLTKCAARDAQLCTTHPRCNMSHLYLMFGSNYQ